MEVIIVVAIVAAIVSAAYPTYNRAKLETRRAEAQTAVVAFDGVVHRYLVENNQPLLVSADITNEFTDYAIGSITGVFTNSGYYRLTLEIGPLGGHIITAHAVADVALDSCDTPGNEKVGQCEDLTCRQIILSHDDILNLDDMISKNESGVTANAATTTCW